MKRAIIATIITVNKKRRGAKVQCRNDKIQLVVSQVVELKLPETQITLIIAMQMEIVVMQVSILYEGSMSVKLAPVLTSHSSGEFRKVDALTSFRQFIKYTKDTKQS